MDTRSPDATVFRSTGSLRFLERRIDGLGPGDLVCGRCEDTVGRRNLGWMDQCLAIETPVTRLNAFGFDKAFVVNYVGYAVEDRQTRHPACEHDLRQNREKGSEIGRAACRERGWQYVWISVGGVSVQHKNDHRIKR